MRKFTDLEKIEIILFSYRCGKTITLYCRQKGISRSTFYRIKHQVLNAFADLLQEQKKRNARKSQLYSHLPAKKKRYHCRLE